MTWAQMLNSNDVGQRLSSSMSNIKLNQNISPAEIQAKIAAHDVKNKDNAQNANAPQAQTQQTAQQNTQTQDTYQAQNTTQNSNAQYQTYQAAPQYQPVQYSQAQYYQPQVQTYSYPVQYQQPQYQTMPSYTYQPVQYQGQANTQASLANTGAVNAYGAQAQAPVQSGQNLNVSTAQAPTDSTTQGQAPQMPTPQVQQTTNTAQTQGLDGTTQG